MNREVCEHMIPIDSLIPCRKCFKAESDKTFEKDSYIQSLEDKLAESKNDLEGLLSNDTAEWKSDAFQKIKGLESKLEKAVEALRAIQIDHFNPLNNRCRQCSDLIEEVLKEIEG